MYVGKGSFKHDLKRVDALGVLCTNFGQSEYPKLLKQKIVNIYNKIPCEERQSFMEDVEVTCNLMLPRRGLEIIIDRYS